MDGTGYVDVEIAVGGSSAQLYGAFARSYKMVARISHPRLDSPIFVLIYSI